MKVDNFENDFYHVVNNTRIGNLGLLSGYLYTNVNDSQVHLTLKLVLAITNHNSRSNNNNINSSILTYQNNKRVTLLND